MAMKKMAGKKAKTDYAALEKREERLHRDLDGDGEKGESRAHQIKVLGYSKAEQLNRGKGKPKAEKKAAK